MVTDTRVERQPPDLVTALRQQARPMRGGAVDVAPLMELIGDAHYVLLGEASHGTHEFYHLRAEITRQLIEQKGFTAVAVEADWPDAFRVNRFVRGRGEDRDAVEALGGFARFPRWMWRNQDVRDFVAWLRDRNAALAPGVLPAGFYGLDLYSLYGSIAAVVEYLDRVDPEAARRARQRYSCFEHFEQDSQAYGYATAFGVTEPCQDEVIAQLVDLRERAGALAQRDGRAIDEEFFSAEQNARLARNAEQYYRSMFRGRVSSWNLRDRHMAETLEQLVAFLRERDGQARVVVWAHNSHLGDASATEMGQHGELNVGQLVRQDHGRDAVLVGFTTDSGTVTAADDWDAPARRKRVRPALPDSYEALFHAVAEPRFLLRLRDAPSATLLSAPRLERAIGVIYRPETERASHYFRARIAEQFDAIVHVDRTTGVVPLDPLTEPDEAEAPEPPETYPFAV
jgi:erythromycin esterase-like protein